MRLLSWLCGSMAIAFLAAGFLLLFQPGTVQAAIGGNCSKCTPQCSYAKNKANCNGGVGCPGTKQNPCSGPLGGACWCSNWDGSICNCD